MLSEQFQLSVWPHERDRFLVAKAKRQLYDPLIARKRRDLTNSAARELTIWLAEEHLIANIEHFPAELRVQAFADRKVLHQRCIEDIRVRST
jgi:hypothetical protein